jgi:hypothetical protein
LSLKLVVPGLVPGIHVQVPGEENVAGRDKPGHDGESVLVILLAESRYDSARERHYAAPNQL